MKKIEMEKIWDEHRKEDLKFYPFNWKRLGLFLIVMAIIISISLILGEPNCIMEPTYKGASCA